MTARSAILFAAGRPTERLRALWHLAGAGQPLPMAEVLEEDRSGTRWFRSLWQSAFPGRDPLPFGPLADDAGAGTPQFLDLLG